MQTKFPLTTIFLATLQPPANGVDPEELEQAIRRAWESGFSRWPDIALPLETFARCLAITFRSDKAKARPDPARRDANQPPLDMDGGAGQPLPFAARIAQLRAEDLYLACAAAHKILTAQRAFDTHVLKRVAERLRSDGTQAALIDDVLQSVRLRMLVEEPSHLCKYSGQGALLNWIYTVCLRHLQNEARKYKEDKQEKTPQDPGKNFAEIIEQLLGTDRTGDQLVEAGIVRRDAWQKLKEAVKNALAGLSPEERHLLRLYYIDGLTMAEIARSFGVDPSTIWRWIQKILQRLREDILHALRLSSDELRSLMRAIDSRRDLSISNFLVPLVDLHRRLDGSVRSATLEELAAHAGSPVRSDLMLSAGLGPSAVYERLEYIRSLIHDPADVRRITTELCDDAAREGVERLEISLSPQLYRNAASAAIVDAALEGIDGRQGVGLILCGLRGEPPTRIDQLVSLGATRRGVVGLRLAEALHADPRGSLIDYALVFQRAATIGLGRTVDARSPAEIRVAVEQLQAQRIGHGTGLCDDPSLVDQVRERGVCIEACLTSDVHLGVMANLEAHPLPQLLKAGVRVCINAPDTLLSSTDAREEHRRARAIPGMDDALLAQAVTFGHEAAFVRGE